MCIDIPNLQCGEIEVESLLEIKVLWKKNMMKNSEILFYCCVFAPPGGFC